MLSNGRVGTIGADEDVAVEEGVVRGVNLDLVVNLLEGQDSLTQEDTLPGNMVPQDVIEVGPSHNILLVTTTKLAKWVYLVCDRFASLSSTSMCCT